MRHDRSGVHWFVPVFALALLLPLGLSPRPAGPPGPARSAPGLDPATDAVRAAWLLSEEEVEALLGSSPLSLRDLAVAGMVSHQERLSLAAVAESRRRLGSWTAVLGRVQGTLRDTVFKGSPRYPLQSPPPSEGAVSPNCEERIAELAEVMTLERLTGKSPTVLARELEGSPFEALLADARPGHPTGAPPGRPQGERRREKAGPGSPQGPPGIRQPDDRPGEVRGWVGS